MPKKTKKASSEPDFSKMDVDMKPNTPTNTVLLTAEDIKVRNPVRKLQNR